MDKKYLELYSNSYFINNLGNSDINVFISEFFVYLYKLKLTN